MTHGVYMPAGGSPTLYTRITLVYTRITLVAEDARVVKVSYPVLPPDANARDVLRWRQHR